ncbi:hypothetical protein K9M16_00155 [Candidatus Babeliales bacterium]|nr:hypothetical protein [Candidatus Babeliales bacterium]
MSNFFKRTIIFLMVILLSNNIKCMQDDSMQIDSYAIPEGYSIETVRFHLGAILTFLTLNPQKSVEEWLSIDTREVDGQPGNRYQQVWKLAEFLSGEQWFIHETCIETDSNGVEHAVFKIRERLNSESLALYQRRLEEQFPGLKECLLIFHEPQFERLLNMEKACKELTKQAKIIYEKHIINHECNTIESFLKVFGQVFFKISPRCSLYDDVYFIPVTSLTKHV